MGTVVLIAVVGVALLVLLYPGLLEIIFSVEPHQDQNEERSVPEKHDHR